MDFEFTTLPVVEPDYITLTDFERNFDVDYWRKVFRENWHISVYLSAIYLVLVFAGKFLMKHRKPFKLNGLLTAWNIGLSIMSIWVVYRTAPEFFHNLSSENGFYHSVCEWKSHNKASAFWSLVIVFSKVIEFGDTAFVVLRKNDLRFIHYYHHVVTVSSWWYVYAYYEPIQMWYVVVNSFVHSLMYPYYALRAMKFPIPKIFAMSITSIQLLQMFLGVYLNLYSVWRMYIVGTPADCPHRNSDTIVMCNAIALIFVFLFGKFFVDNYFSKGNVKSKKV